VNFGDVANRNLTLDVTVQPGNVVFNNTSDYTLSGVGAIGGSTNLSKSGAGKVTISTSNTYTGTTQINEGTVQVGTGGTSGSLGSGNISNNGTLIFNRSDNITISQTIDGNGDLRKQGAGTLRLNGINSYAGATTIEQGTIIVNSSQSLGNIPGSGTTINSGAALDVSGDATANDLNFQGKVFTIAGTGVNGTGALTNSGNTAQQNAFQNITLSADASVGGTGRMDIRRAIQFLIWQGTRLPRWGPGSSRWSILM
jgi:autotransporter-associated beta strand protein